MLASRGLGIKLPMKPPTKEPTMPRTDVAKNPICWVPGRSARAIKPTENPTTMDQSVGAGHWDHHDLTRQSRQVTFPKTFR